MTSSIQIQTTLVRKFSSTVSTGFGKTNSLVATKLQNQIQKQTQRLQNAIQKKIQTQKKMSDKQQQQTKYSSQLRNKINKDINTHSKHRQQFLQKRIKDQKLKSQYVQQINNQYKKTQFQKKKQRRADFNKFKDQMKLFFQSKQKLLIARMKSQISVQAQHQNALQRKKRSQALNQQYSLKIDQNIKKKHSPVKDRIQSLIKQKKINIHNVHNQQIDKNCALHNQILNNRENTTINSIGLHQSRSQNLLKKNKKQNAKKLQRIQSLKKDNIDRIKSLFNQKKKDSAHRANSCKCWSKGLQKSNKFKINNEEQMNLGSEIKENPSLKRAWTSQLYKSRQSFANTNRLYWDRVKNQQNNILQKERAQSQRRLLRHDQISKGNKLRRQIQNQANCLIRKAKLIQKQNQTDNI